ncbi:MAG: glycoside hydrolase family 3 C-terminal domain-containing protein [Sphingomonadales bacterium]|nr:glycoside hydrolase family 3 C-terminal domain-containing protein [Sphingomonadales bacterium]MDE2168169.1 glycoside hydrolase family 3 C-terminal domain-containing protein [Sphingomonadales bacterium]
MLHSRQALFSLTACALALGMASQASAQGAAAVSAPAADNAVSNPDARASAMVARMTQAEKIALVFAYFSTDFPPKHFTRPEGGQPQAAGIVPKNDRLGIPYQSQTDAGVGVASQRGPQVRERTALPSGIATAATWNHNIAFAGGAMIGNEARLSGINVQLAGGVNLMREPRNGRNFEYGGEDPLLAGTMVGKQIAGIQSQHVISTLKHYAFNDQETSRNFIDVKIDEAAARQSDLLAFELALRVGNPGSVMCSYNRVNGAYACENDWLLNKVLKQDFGFKGYVMSDWGATHSTSPAANAGLDQQSGWPFDKSAYFDAALGEAVNNGHVSPARLDDMAHRILRAMYANGLFDVPLAATPEKIDYAAHAAVTRADEEEAIVLLKNNGLLPLAASARTIAIIGGHADVGVLSGGGSAQVYPVGGNAVPDDTTEGFPRPIVYDPSSPMKALQGLTKAKITYIDGKDKAAAARLAARSDIAIVFATQWTAESKDVPDLNLPGDQNALIEAITKANRKTAVVLETGGPVLMPWLPKVGAVMEAWFPGTAGGEAIARVLTGAVNPSGHLPVSFPASVNQLPRPVVDGDVTDKTEHPHTDYDVEGAAVGYKWYQAKGLKPLFSFGEGLSYTSFATSGLAAHAQGKGVAVDVTIANTGTRAGKAVAQIYIACPGAGWEAPRRLGAFDKVALAPGEKRTLSLTIDPLLLGTWDAAARSWTIKGGACRVEAGSSAATILASVPVTLPTATLNAHGE